jgi:glycerol kinase
MTKYIGSIDQGTTSTRFIVFDHLGNIIALDQMEHKQIFPKPGWVEHDPEEIFNNTLTVIRNALRKSNLSLKDLKAIGITNQRETSVFWDRTTGDPIGNAIVWQDTRTDQLCNDLAGDEGLDRFRQKTGLPLATYFSGPKIRWALDNDPLINKANHDGKLLFGNIDSWLIWKLTGGDRGGVHVTDVSNASRTLLMDLSNLNWDDSILSAMGVPLSIMPAIRSSSEIYGYAHIDDVEIPIASDLGDQQAALFGQTCFLPGEAKNTYGTGCFMLMNTGNTPVQSRNGLLTTVGYKLGQEKAVYCLEGSIAIAGALVQWLRDNLKIIENSNEIEPLARTVEDNGGIYFVPAFSGLFAPYWRSDARGAIVGMTRYIHRGHIARAVLEATAYQTREVLDAMESDSGVRLSSLRVDGGMVNNNFLMQFQSDILNVPVVRPRILETTALGAAYAAGLAVGYWDNLDQLRENWSKASEWTPKMDENQRNILFLAWKKAVTRTFDWVQ